MLTSAPWARALWPAMGVILGLGVLTSSCSPELRRGIACGDGYVDLEEGEECDPGDPSSYEEACYGTDRPDGEGACDPFTCTIIRDTEQCAVCGDDDVDPEVGEECDGDNLDGAYCVGSNTLPRCTECRLDYSTCPTCGNGEIDDDRGEECDSLGGGLVDQPVGCEELPQLTGKDYTSGYYNACDPDCLFSRAGCGYCGNGTLEGSEPLDLKGNVTLPEICDRGDFNDSLIANKFGGSSCYAEPNDPPTGLRPVVECSDDCRDFDLLEPVECCLLQGEPCPDDVSTPRCCYELDHPEETEACQPEFTNNMLQNVCR